MAGRKIDDHSSWIGKGEAGSVFPDGAHKLNVEKDDGHAGGIEDYPDTTEHIERDQEAGVSKIKSKPMKPGFRY